MRLTALVLLVAVLALTGCALPAKKGGSAVPKAAMPDPTGLTVAAVYGPHECGRGTAAMLLFLDENGQPGVGALYLFHATEDGKQEVDKLPSSLVDFEVRGEDVVFKEAFIDWDGDGYIDKHYATIEAYRAEFPNNDSRLCNVANELYSRRGR